MKINNYEFPKSSFLGMSKDTAIIMDKILKNERVLKLLYYNDPNCLTNGSKLTSEQIKEMFDTKQISNVPKLRIDREDKSYLRITYNNFVPNDSNPFYRDHTVEIKIICHFDNWNLGNYELRPYRIAGEIDSMLNNQHLSGIGLFTFVCAEQDIYDSEFGGITLTYLAVRGNEDRTRPLQ